MKRIISLFILIFPSIAMADDFEIFLKNFFSDSVFQKNHISYPIHGYYTYICDSNPDGTCEKDIIFANNPNEWDYIGYGYGKPGVVYTKNQRCPTKLPKEKNCIYIELSEPESDYNLQLYFKNTADSWQLIYLWYFEP